MTESMERTHGHAHGEDARPSPYPTYRDGPVPEHEATTTRPTDVGLPQSKRTYFWPAIIAIAVAAVVGLALVVWGTGEVATDDAPPLAPGSQSEATTAIEEDGAATPGGGSDADSIDVPGGN